jgi:tRNA(adenine34) deaminase
MGEQLVDEETLAYWDNHADERFMLMAMVEARAAEADGDVPIGAVICHEGQVIARAHNQKEYLDDPTAHAEILAITQAAAALGRWRLTGTRLYVTLEPCAMCAGAIVHARIDTVIYGATDPKAGAAGSLMNLLADERLNHQPEVVAGVLAEDCGEILAGFFRKLRGRNALLQ